jgi:hypothetical protein
MESNFFKCPVLSVMVVSSLPQNFHLGQEDGGMGVRGLYEKKARTKKAVVF